MSNRDTSEMISATLSVSPRRASLLALAAGLSVAAAVAIFAILTHSFDGTDARLIGTSLGFSAFSLLSAAGAPARRRPGLVVLGQLTTVGAALCFALLESLIWGLDPDWIWRAFAASVVLSLAASHASLVLSSRRASDPRIITRLTAISVICATVDAALVLSAIVGLFDNPTDFEVRLAAVLVITMMLTTALPPVLRRALRPRPSRRPDRPFASQRRMARPANLH